MLVKRRRRWINIKPTLVQRLVLAGHIQHLPFVLYVTRTSGSPSLASVKCTFTAGQSPGVSRVTHLTPSQLMWSDVELRRIVYVAQTDEDRLLTSSPSWTSTCVILPEQATCIDVTARGRVNKKTDTVADPKGRGGGLRGFGPPFSKVELQKYHSKRIFSKQCPEPLLIGTEN